MKLKIVGLVVVLLLLVSVVQAAPPVANAGPDRTYDVNQQILFDAWASSDSDAGDTLTYQWNLGDGRQPTGKSFPRSYSAPGTYIVTLIVTDNTGLTASDTATITVKPAPNGCFSRETKESCAVCRTSISTITETALAGEEQKLTALKTAKDTLDSAKLAIFSRILGFGGDPERLQKLESAFDKILTKRQQKHANFKGKIDRYYASRCEEIGPDFVLEKIVITTPSPASNTPEVGGSNIQFRATVRNIGTRNFNGDIQADIYVKNAGASSFFLDHHIDRVSLSSQLSSGSVDDFTFSIGPRANTGLHAVKVVLTPSVGSTPERVATANEKDKTFHVRAATINAPDLVISSFTRGNTGAAMGTDILASATIKNIGTITFNGNVVVDLFLNGEKVATKQLSVGLNSGSTVTVSNIGPWRYVNAGPHTVKAVITSTPAQFVAPEETDLNNEAEESFIVAS